MEEIENSAGIYSMMADYMEKGFLENIVDMIKHDCKLHAVVEVLIKDERLRVRIGAIALIEELKSANVECLPEIANLLIPLLENSSVTVRGDALYALSLIGGHRHITNVEKLLYDENKDIRESARECLEALTLVNVTETHTNIIGIE